MNRPPEPGTLVRYRGRPVDCKVLDNRESAVSHGPITIWETCIQAVADVWCREPQWVRTVELTPAPPDLEDWPTAPV